MKRKTEKARHFMADMHDYITHHPQFREKTRTRAKEYSEVDIQRELRPLLIRHLENHFQAEGYVDPERKAHDAFYWECQEKRYRRDRQPLFGARNYPDFIIKEPYLVAVEYKQSPNGSTVKRGIGQSMMYTLCEDFDFVYYLFHDESDDKHIEKTADCELEKGIIQRMWEDFNVFVRFV
jgi:hypothetical protein